MSVRLENDSASLDLHKCARIFQHFPRQLSSPSQPPFSGATELYATIIGRNTRIGPAMSGRSGVGRPRNVRGNGSLRDMRHPKDERLRWQNDRICAKTLSTQFRGFVFFFVRNGIVVPWSERNRTHRSRPSGVLGGGEAVRALPRRECTKGPP